MRIMTFNLRHDADHWPNRLPLVIDMLLQEDPDIIAIQEVSLRIDQSSEILEKLNQHRDLPYIALIEPKWGIRSHEGIGIFSRLPVQEKERLQLPSGGRVAQRISILMDGRAVDIFNTHLHHLPPGSERIRLKQVKNILSWMQDRKDQSIPSILAGDFNATPGSKTILAVYKEMDSSYSLFHGCEPKYTFPTPLVKIPLQKTTIDFIFLSPGDFMVQNAHLTGTIPAKHDESLYPSDHYGLVVDLFYRGKDETD